MEDKKIVDLYWMRDENAIRQSDLKYGRMLHSLSFSLLSSREDAEECVNDTYLQAWGAMPTARPDLLGAFLSKITRRLSIDRFRAEHRQKRGGMGNVLAELDECIPSGSTVEKEYEAQELRDAINQFLYAQSAERRVMFLRRYFHAQSVAEIAEEMGLTQAKVKVTLFRLRGELKKELEEKALL